MLESFIKRAKDLVAPSIPRLERFHNPNPADEFFLDFESGQLRGPTEVWDFSRIQHIGPAQNHDRVVCDVLLKIRRGPLLKFKRDFFSAEKLSAKVRTKLGMDPRTYLEWLSSYQGNDITTLVDKRTPFSIYAALGEPDSYSNGVSCRTQLDEQPSIKGDLAFESGSLCLYNLTGQRKVLAKGSNIEWVLQEWRRTSDDHDREDRSRDRFDIHIGLKDGRSFKLIYSDPDGRARASEALMARRISELLRVPRENVFDLAEGFFDKTAPCDWRHSFSYLNYWEGIRGVYSHEDIAVRKDRMPHLR